MDIAALESWLAAYGDAWQRKDAAAFTALFARDVHYYWTPFEEPQVGRDALADAFGSAVARQHGIRFTASALSMDGLRGIAHWHCSFTRADGGRCVRLDGVFVIEYSTDGLCLRFREWWHSDEPLHANSKSTP